jgi:hypothetical protein
MNSVRIRPRYVELMAARNARAAMSSAAVEAAVLTIEMDIPTRHYFTQTDSATTETFFDDGQRMPAPAHSRSWTPINYTVREVEENTLRTRRARVRYAEAFHQALIVEEPMIYTAAELEENEDATIWERHRKRLMGRRTSNLTPSQLRRWIRSVRGRPSGWSERKQRSVRFAREAKALVTKNDSFQFGLQRVYIPDL